MKEMKKVAKSDILDLLKNRGDLNLMNIRDGVGAGNNSTVLHHLNVLLDQGLIRKTVNKTYKIVDVDGLPATQIETIRVPLIIAKAGPNDILLEENTSTIKIDKTITSYSPENLIMVKISGDSMNPRFFDGDLLLFIKPTSKPNNNDIVLWRVDGGAKVKRFQWTVNENNEPRGLLISENLKDNDINKPINIDDENSSYLGKFLFVVKRSSDI